MTVEASSFDALAQGALAQYDTYAMSMLREKIAQNKLRSNLKMYSYADSIQRVLANKGVPEAWLSRLSRQTLSSVLGRGTRAHYQVWACLHLYLLAIQIPVELENKQTDTQLLGQALTNFGNCEPPESANALAISDHETLTLNREPNANYAQAKLIAKFQAATKPFAVNFIRQFDGIAITQSSAGSASAIGLILRHAITGEISIRIIAIPSDNGGRS